MGGADVAHGNVRASTDPGSIVGAMSRNTGTCVAPWRGGQRRTCQLWKPRFKKSVQCMDLADLTAQVSKATWANEYEGQLRQAHDNAPPVAQTRKKRAEHSRAKQVICRNLAHADHWSTSRQASSRLPGSVGVNEIQPSGAQLELKQHDYPPDSSIDPLRLNLLAIKPNNQIRNQ
jgi:hypothetical protein